MRRAVSGRDTLQGLPLNRNPGRPNRLPLSRASDDAIAYSLQGRRIGMPEPSPAHAVRGFQMQVKPRRVLILAGSSVRKVGADVGLVRALVFGESDVPVDTEHGATDRPGVDLDMGADGVARLAEVCNDPQHRLLHVGLVPSPIRLEPGALVVRFQLAEELEQPRTKVCCSHRCSPLVSVSLDVLPGTLPAHAQSLPCPPPTPSPCRLG